MESTQALCHATTGRRPPDGGVAESSGAIEVVFLVRPGDGLAPVFYSEGAAEGDGDADPPGRGMRGWLDRNYRKLRDILDRPEGGLRSARRLWTWLRRFTWPDEPMLRRLRGAEAIELRHPASLTPAEARSAWERYLRARRWRHLGWLAVNVALSPISVLLTPIPGPNLIGYWFVYRAICHLLALLGIQRALGPGGAARPRATADLDATLDAADGESVASFAARLGLGQPGDFADHVGAARGWPGGPPRPRP